MNEERTAYNLFIGKTVDGYYLFLENAFKHSDDFKGLTWNEFEFLTEREKEERDDDYFYCDEWEYLFGEYIKYSHDYNTTFNEWVEMAKDEWGSLDDSYAYTWWLSDAMEYAKKKEDIDYEYSNCVGGWRCFNEDSIKKENFEYYIPKNLRILQKLYKEYEEK